MTTPATPPEVAPSVGPHPSTDPAPRLEPDQLLLLQLHARGYTWDQIAHLVGQTASDVVGALSRAAARLGATTVAEAVRHSLERGLIL